MSRIIPWNKPAHDDHNLDPWYWYNVDKAQTHYFKSILNLHYPRLKEAFKDILACPPGRCLMLMHRYYLRFTRDGSDLHGMELTSDALELLPPKVFTRGGALGHEN